MKKECNATIVSDLMLTLLLHAGDHLIRLYFTFGTASCTIGNE